jgi:hypothetical protein
MTRRAGRPGSLHRTAASSRRLGRRGSTVPLSLARGFMTCALVVGARSRAVRATSRPIRSRLKALEPTGSGSWANQTTSRRLISRASRAAGGTPDGRAETQSRTLTLRTWCIRCARRCTSLRRGMRLTRPPFTFYGRFATTITLVSPVGAIVIYLERCGTNLHMQLATGYSFEPGGVIGNTRVVASYALDQGRATGVFLPSLRRLSFSLPIKSCSYGCAARLDARRLYFTDGHGHAWAAAFPLGPARSPKH